MNKQEESSIRRVLSEKSDKTTYLECRLCWSRQGDCNCSMPDWEEHCVLPGKDACYDGRHWRGDQSSVLAYEDCPLEGRR